MWDQDTLAEEAKGHGDLLSTIIGRFERNPDLYYSMRQARAESQLRKEPARLGLYDDAAVAAARLDRLDGAIRLIERKRAWMKEHPKSATPDDWYRYYANAGTFHAHAWLHDGADPSRVQRLKRGRDLVAKAISLNKAAHFGREKYQLALIDWILSKPKTDEESFGKYLGKREMHGREAIKGLAGLVRLGAAWESVDVFDALKYCLSLDRQASLAQLANLRVGELVRKGRRSLLPDFKHSTDPLSLGLSMPMHGDDRRNERDFRRLRGEADDWYRRRTGFMVSRLKAGRHPDTDPTFWSGYEDKPLRVPEHPFWSHARFSTSAMVWGGILLVTSPIWLGVPLLVRWLVRRRRRPPQAGR